MKHFSIYIIAISFLLSLQNIVFANDNSKKYKVKIERNVKYGEGLIQRDGETIIEDLWMDVYTPIDSNNDQHPAVFFTYGGAFHRGTPRFTYEIDGQQDTSPEEYCTKLAERGYVCFAINYRLTPDSPIPTLKDLDKALINRDNVKLMMDRVIEVRDDMGLDALDPNNPEDVKLQSDAVIAAAEDLQNAIQFVKQNAVDLLINQDKIIIGGFSAGAATSWNVAYGLKEPVAGVFLLSGAPIVFELDNIKKEDKNPPILQFLAQTDLTGARIANPLMIDHYNTVGMDYEFAWVPGFGHFYPAGATSMSGDAIRVSVERRLVNFLERIVSQDLL